MGNYWSDCTLASPLQGWTSFGAYQKKHRLYSPPFPLCYHIKKLIITLRAVKF